MNKRIAALSIFTAGVLALPLSAASALADQTGTFSGVSNHWVNGGVKVSTAGGKTTITLNSNFKSQSGPDLYIYVGNGSPTKRIAKLKKFKGSQTYTYKGTAAISSVHVYCKRYTVGFGTAKLN